MMLKLKRKCFHCKDKFDRNSMYKLNMKTSQGIHKVFLCEECATSIMVENPSVKMENNDGSI